MKLICFYTLFDDLTNKPRCAGIRIGDNITTYDLYRPGAGKKIKTITDTVKKIRDFLLESNDRGYAILTSNFKNILAAFDLPLDSRTYNVYDVHIDNSGPIRPTNNQSTDMLLLKKILDRMAIGNHYEYQKLISNAAVVYQDLQRRGICINDEMFYPEWSMMTFSGRSKTVGFNIQGFHEDHNVRVPNSNPTNVLLHFDWMAADIRAASLLSGDEILANSFDKSDPYTEMVNFLNGDIDREECKKFLLKSINSMDVNSDAFVIYKKLGQWIRNCYEVTRDQDGMLQTLLNRKFKVSRSRNSLAVLNGAMQGTVAHAMHAVIRRIWDKVGSYILAEIHDSIILSVPNDPTIIRSVINVVAPIMMRPFNGLLDDNPLFPVRVSVGKKWKKWQLFETYRASGVEYVKKKRQNVEAATIESQEDREKIEE